MTPSFDALRNASSLTEARAAFGDFLGLNAPVPTGALNRAFADLYYRHTLILNRNRPETLRLILDQPANAAFEEGGPLSDGPGSEEPESAASAVAASPVTFSNGQLAAKAGKALFDWALTGFAVLDQEAFEARFSACERCDMLSEPPETLAYALTRTKRSDPRVCGACGCTAARKARLASEQCPLTDPANPALTRWGEPARRTAAQ
jgi:hypothetical protein